MTQTTYPDLSDLFAAKAERRRQLAALPWEEKVAIIEKMRQEMPRIKGKEALNPLHFYHTIIKQSIAHCAADSFHSENIEIIPVFDERNDNYLLIALDPSQPQSSYKVLIHIRIQEGSIRIEQDSTVQGICEQLITAGIPLTVIIQ